MVSSFAEGQSHALSQGGQELVADLVPIVVIDGLETIQVEVGHRQPGAVAPGPAAMACRSRSPSKTRFGNPVRAS